MRKIIASGPQQHNILYLMQIYIASIVKHRQEPFKLLNRDMTKPTKWLSVQRRLGSAWASAQSDQSLRCHHEETLDPQLPIERTAKTLSLRWVFAGYTLILFLSCRGSIYFSNNTSVDSGHTNRVNMLLLEGLTHLVYIMLQVWKLCHEI